MFDNPRTQPRGDGAARVVNATTTTNTTPAFATDAECYEAVRARDTRADGRFYYSVLTTGVYCRPSCAARLARPENVGFHRSTADAERAGYRACKRCRPNEAPAQERQAQLILSAREMLEVSETAPNLDDLAAHVGLSPSHFHRMFKEHVGMTPREYFAAHRLKRVRDGLRSHPSVTEAMYDAGYGSSSRFYEEATGVLGMTPSDLRRGGDGLEIRATVRTCSLGFVLVAATTKGVCAVTFGDTGENLLSDLRERFSGATIRISDDELGGLADAVIATVEAKDAPTDIPLDLVGTAFQRRVWQALREIPAGETVTYAELAARIGAPRAVRAVGTACGKNPVAVVVPCHRVLRIDGQLGGYRWGVARKKTLLERERSK